MAINYQFDVINPFQAALQGYGAGAQILQQERSAAQQARQEEQQSQLFALQMEEARAKAAQVQEQIAAAREREAVYAEFYDAIENNTLDNKLIAKVMAVDEKLGTFGAETLAQRSAEQKLNDFNNLMQPTAALAMGDVESAKKNLEIQRDAARNSGDEQAATVIDGYLRQLDTPDGPKFVQAALARGAMQIDQKAFQDQWASISAMGGEKETETVRTARTYAATFGPPGSPEYMQAFRQKLLPPPAAAVQVNIGPEGRPLTAGQKKVDETFAETYAAFVTGGASDAAKQAGQLAGALVQLEQNKELTGPLIGLMPDFIQSFAAPEALAVKETVSEVVQRNLRAVLGPQFTAKEGEGLIARAFNPSLGVPENIKRVRRLLQQIERANADTQAAVDYYEANGTLQGFKYKAPKLSDFEDAIDGKGPEFAPGVNFNSMDDRTLLRQDITKLTPAQRKALTDELDRRGL
jgi:hypothetical protein